MWSCRSGFPIYGVLQDEAGGTITFTPLIQRTRKNAGFDRGNSARRLDAIRITERERGFPGDFLTGVY